VAEGLGHLQADLAGADDQRGLRLAIADGAIELERLLHVVQQMDAGQVDTGQGQHDWVRRRGHDEAVVRDLSAGPVGGPYRDLLDSASIATAGEASPSRSPLASRSAIVRASSRQSRTSPPSQ
jgi:hypothetical protein